MKVLNSEVTEIFMRKVAVIIPNFNGEKFLGDALGALEYDKYSVIVVDNGSTDGSVAFIKNYFPQTEIICLDENYGFSRAVNEGLKKCDAKFAVLLNNDTRAEKGFVDKLLEAMEADERIFSCQAKMLQMDYPEKIDSAGDFYCALGWGISRGKDKQKILYCTRDRIFSACAGAAMYRTEVFRRIGYFDEAHFAYLEDVDVGYRARIAGYENAFAPEAIVYHKGSGATGSRHNAFKVKLAARNNLYMIYKNMPRWQILINLPLLLIGWLIKALYFALKGMGLSYVKGSWKGILLARKGHKTPFLAENFDHCWEIQIQLWKALRYLIMVPFR